MCIRDSIQTLRRPQTIQPTSHALYSLNTSRKFPPTWKTPFILMEKAFKRKLILRRLTLFLEWVLTWITKCGNHFIPLLNLRNGSFTWKLGIHWRPILWFIRNFQSHRSTICLFFPVYFRIYGGYEFKLQTCDESISWVFKGRHNLTPTPALAHASWNSSLQLHRYWHWSRLRLQLWFRSC